MIQDRIWILRHFHEAMGHFRVGRWQEGLLKLADVEKAFPTETDLRAIRQEMEVRARISEYEVEENKHNKMLKLRNYWSAAGSYPCRGRISSSCINDIFRMDPGTDSQSPVKFLAEYAAS